MPIKEMEQIKINEITDNDCLLFMWVTSPFLKIGIDLMNKWGFDFSTIGFVSGCEALALSGRAACTKPLLYAGTGNLVGT